MLTRSLVSDLTVMAGTDFLWKSVPSARPTSIVRSGLFRWISDYSGRICAFCGEVSELGEIAHIVSAGPEKRGYVPGNLGWACFDCNDLDGSMGPIVRFETIRHPELIPTVWPGSGELREIGQNVRFEAEAAKAAKRTLRGM